jgi:hypothetical protein
VLEEAAGSISEGMSRLEQTNLAEEKSRVQRDLQYGYFVSHDMLVIKSSKFLIITQISAAPSDTDESSEMFYT